MVFYFSGTGNSQLAANRIAAATQDAIVSINACMKTGNTDVFHTERPLVFVTPTYAWRMPRVVMRWIHNARFEGCGEAYFVLTCAGDCGNAAAYARRITEEKGFSFQGLATVCMPENYLAMFPTPEKAECDAILERALPRVAELAAYIERREPFPNGAAPTWRDRMKSGPINTLYYRFLVKDRGFSASERCVSCGMCAKRCPVRDIEMVNGKPQWKGHCTHCMACIAGCPAGAIAYGSASKGRHRHYIMED